MRRLIILAVMLGLWQGFALYKGNPLLFPSLGLIGGAFWEGLRSGELISAAGVSLQLLLYGYGVGIIIAAAVSLLAVISKTGGVALDLTTSMFFPLPAIALLPLAILWFGLGTTSLLVILVHAVLWPLSLNAYTGFMTVAPTLKMVGRNYGLRGPRFVWRILLPAAFPSILTGLRISWAFAWRTLIAAELVFGVTAGNGGLGWYIFLHKNNLEIPKVFGGLLLVVMIGVFVENVIFKNVEKRTVERWGMQVRE